MDKNIALVMRGYLSLTDEQKKEVRNYIAQVDKPDGQDLNYGKLAVYLGVYGLDLETKDLGPIASVNACPCCKR